MPGFLKCACEHCGGRIEYPVEAVGASAPCPHCQQETALKIEGGDDADVIEIGGGKARLVIATIIVCVVAIAALVAAAIWVKKKRGEKEPVRSQPPVSSNPANVSPNSVLARIELDPARPVVPVVGRFQNGLNAAQIRNGRELFGGACNECHRLYDPATYGITEWEKTIGTMRGKAKLRGRAGDELELFVRTVRN